jgi:hypothetical protein
MRAFDRNQPGFVVNPAADRLSNIFTNFIFMKARQIALILSISLLLLVLWCCQKRIFGFVEVRGRMVHFFTREPRDLQVRLMADDATSSKNSTEASILLDETQTGSDGSFRLRSKPSRRAAYYLSFSDANGLLEINAKTNKINDLGDVETGTMVFNCTINLVPVSDSCIQLFNPDVGEFFVYSAGTSTQVIMSDVHTKKSFEESGRNFIIHYRKGKNCKVYQGPDFHRDYVLKVPIATSSELKVTLLY